MKRILTLTLLLLCVVMAFALVACDMGGPTTADSDTPTTPSDTPTTVPTKVFYTVTFDNAGIGAALAPVTVEEGTQVTAPADYGTEGYRFDGWFLGDAAYDFSAPVTADITLTAKWTKFHTVTVVSGDDTTTVTVADGETLAGLEPPVRAGYRFDGWQKDDADYDLTTPVTGDITITAKWAKVHTVTVVISAGNTVTKTVADGETIADLEAPVLEGHEFGGWKLGEDDYDLTTPVTGDITITAKWTICTYRVTFVNGSDTSVITEVTVDYNDNATLPAAPENFVWAVTKTEYDKIFSVKENQTVVLLPVAAGAYTNIDQWWNVNKADGQAPLQLRGVTYTGCSNMAMNDGGTASFEIDATAVKLRFWTNPGLKASYTFYLDGHKIGEWEFDNTEGTAGVNSGWLNLLNDLPTGKHTLTISGTGTIVAMQLKEYHPAVTVDLADESTPAVSRVAMFGNLSTLTDPVRAGYNLSAGRSTPPAMRTESFPPKK